MTRPYISTIDDVSSAEVIVGVTMVFYWTCQSRVAIEFQNAVTNEFSYLGHHGIA